MKKRKIKLLACQVGPFHLTLTKNKCPESQKLDTRRRRENLIAISPRVTKSNNIVCTHYVKVFCILCLSIILFDTSKALKNLTFILTAKSHSVEFLYVCYCYYLLSGYHEDRRVNRRNYIKFISKL